MTLRIGIVAGEPSGDLLGAAILQGLRQHFPDISVTGVAGNAMREAGASTLFSLEKLSVMGFSEVLWRAPELLRLRKRVKNYFLHNPPDVFIGVDAPDFNLPIEIALKAAGIKTVHCNSPTIWAWRKNRIHKIVRAVDLMLTLFPFESAYYEAERVPVRYIGHPLADTVPLENNFLAARQRWNIPANKKMIALLPGSRAGEIKYIGPVILQAAQRFFEKYPETIFMSPMVNDARLLQFKQQWQTITPSLPLQCLVGHSREIMAAADIVVLASGTATLEALLVKRPMVVVYRGSTLSYWVAKQLVAIRQFSLPNILANRVLVPELIQHDATPENILNAMLDYVTDKKKTNALQHAFLTIHQTLRCQASEQAALAIKGIIQP